MRDSQVLILASGGTIAMVQQKGTGYAPYPGFLTEILRTQARFHDPSGDSIFSWSDTTDRYKQWSETYSRSPSRPHSPEPNLSVPSPPGPSSSSLHIVGPPFGKSIKVRSSAPNGTSTRYALSSKTLDDGTLEMQMPSLITPVSNRSSQQRVRYTVLEYDPLLDSSEMGLQDWTRIARDVALNYSSFDAFVVLHGTDTMSYTASALSFLLENLGKTVILTGAQVPLSELRNDAIENVLGALILASQFIIPEVCLFFASTLYRGNRSSKVSNNSLLAFDSPNLPPLARVGIGIDVAWTLVERAKSVRPFRAHDSMSADVALLRLFPGMPTETIKTFLNSNISGLCIETFGAGNAPSRPELLKAFREATDRGVVIVNITQCLQGEVSAIYAVGKKLADAGIVAGADMTPECALTKLAYLLGKPELSRAQVRELMGRSLRGELTTRTPVTSSDAANGAQTPHKGTNVSGLLSRILQRPNEEDSSDTNSEADIVGGDSKALEREVAEAERVILPYLIYRSTAANDASSLSWHLSTLARLDASITGSFNSMSVTPSISSSSNAQGLSLSLSSSMPSLDHPRTTGGPVDLPPLDSLYPLHLASSRGHSSCIRLLLEAGSSVHLKDEGGRTPLFLAARAGHEESVAVLREAGALLTQEEKEQVRWIFSLSGSKSCRVGAGRGGRAKVGGEEESRMDVELWRMAGVDLDLDHVDDEDEEARIGVRIETTRWNGRQDGY